MITIQPYYSTDSNSVLISEINKDDSILIIGKGSNEYKLNDFVKPKDLTQMKELYGDSELTDAYKIALKNGAANTFVMNCLGTSDFIDCIEFAKYHNFAYVTPIGINLSDTFYDSSQNRDFYYAEYYLNNFGNYTDSLLIFTDEHASLYENIDQFLNDMNTKITNFKTSCYYSLSNFGRNMAFCLNGLEDVKYSNIVLASRLASSTLGEYPDCGTYKATYDMDSEDFDDSSDIVYFKNNLTVNTSIENFKNLRILNDPNKLIPIDIVIKHIERTLDTSFVTGKLYTKYIEMTLSDYLDEYFRKIQGSLIRSYSIGEISFVKDTNATGHITVDIDIYPINSLELVNVLLEVK
jgi:hypothetical protein